MKTQVELLKESCDIKDAACVRYQKRIAELEEENKKLKSDVEFFRQCYLDLKKLCEDDGFLLPNEEIAKMFNLDEIK